MNLPHPLRRQTRCSALAGVYPGSRIHLNGRPSVADQTFCAIIMHSREVVIQLLISPSSSTDLNYRPCFQCRPSRELFRLSDINDIYQAFGETHLHSTHGSSRVCLNEELFQVFGSIATTMLSVSRPHEKLSGSKIYRNDGRPGFCCRPSREYSRFSDLPRCSALAGSYQVFRST